MDKTLISANAGTPYPKYFSAAAVISVSSLENEPYPNRPLIISSEAITKPKLAGIENNNESSNELFWILETLLIFFDLKAYDSTGNETVPTAIPAIARFIW